MKVKELFPYLRVKGAAAAIEFYRRAFEAKERFRLTEPDGRIGHAEVELGEAGGDALLDHLPLPAGLLGAALADLDHRAQVLGPVTG